jgi:hypothetical protein
MRLEVLPVLHLQLLVDLLVHLVRLGLGLQELPFRWEVVVLVFVTFERVPSMFEVFSR